MSTDNLSAQYKSDWAVFLPALSSFYIGGIGRQVDTDYFDSARLPAKIPDVRSLNFLDPHALFYYGSCLYSAGHADIDPVKGTRDDWVVHTRDRRQSFVLGDSGGFQILTGQWPANWRDPNCPRAQKKREHVLNWLENYSDYGMTLDIPTRIIRSPECAELANVYTYDHAKQATHINNEYWIRNRRGNFRVLCVLHGGSHAESDDWYQEMKRYCDPKIYPDRHFNGWSTAGVNMRDVHQVLLRLVTIIHDGLLEKGQHDWIHYLGTSWLEYATLFTSIQRAIRRYHNPNLTISFDCASPFFGASKGVAYYQNTFEPGKKWTYKMAPTAEDKKYSTDTRTWSQAVLQDNIHPVWTDSPISSRVQVRDLCYRGPGFVGKHGKETKTSWDTLSYMLVQGHNVWMHIQAVIQANLELERGNRPKMMIFDDFDLVYVDHVIDQIFAARDRDRSMQIIQDHEYLWRRFRSGHASSHSNFRQFFELSDSDDIQEFSTELLEA